MAVALAALGIPAGAAAGALEEHRPVLRFDSSETLLPIPVPAFFHPGHWRPVVYGHSIRGHGGSRWLQYWILYADNPQDRGIFRTGRHEGDWEMVQVRLDGRGRPQAATFRAHTWANTCAWSDVERTRAGAPVVFVSNGSHANYPRAGVKDRPWPDPNDFADGKGRALRPPVISFDDGSFHFGRGRWGSSKAGWVPGEQSSPKGPPFQPAWADPAGLERSARSCSAAPPTRGWQTALTIGLAALVLGGAVLFVVRFRRRAANSRRS